LRRGVPQEIPAHAGERAGRQPVGGRPHRLDGLRAHDARRHRSADGRAKTAGGSVPRAACIVGVRQLRAAGDAGVYRTGAAPGDRAAIRQAAARASHPGLHRRVVDRRRGQCRHLAARLPGQPDLVRVSHAPAPGRVPVPVRVLRSRAVYSHVHCGHRRVLLRHRRAAAEERESEGSEEETRYRGGRQDEREAIVR